MKEQKSYDAYSTKGQRVTGDGTHVIMENGKRFKRTVLPAPVAIKEQPLEIEEDL